ncbi:hypothetical protein ACE1ET_11415 [Saccharicrinis sp. FJH62]|uniref:hypothetical protein n=1 Tax=Saccharicrinis sp. FJH62 TaxID=3344657 RepID=UPI0035D40CF7
MIIDGNNNKDRVFNIVQNGIICPFVLTTHPESKVTDPFSKQHAGYHSIKADLNQALELLSNYEIIDNDVIKEALWKQSVILLGRIFNQGEGGKVTLDKGILRKDEILSKTLDFFLILRNKYIAHQGLNEEETNQSLIVLSPSETKEIINVGAFHIRTVKISPEEINDLKNLLIKLSELIEMKITKVENKIVEYYRHNWDIDDLYKFSIKRVTIEKKGSS